MATRKQLRQRQTKRNNDGSYTFFEIISIVRPKNGTCCEVLILKSSLGRNDSQLFI